VGRGVGDVLKDPGKSAALRQQIMRFSHRYPVYRGLSLDFESLPDDADPGLHELHSGALRRDARAQSAPLRQRAVATSDSDLKPSPPTPTASF
jgi:hypothetical protein